jgi:hypothetical protein
MTTTTTNYGWTKPDVGASNDAWGGLLNSDLDGIDSTVKSVSNAIPAASGALPAMDGTAAAGSSAAFARGDHVHPTDTSRYAASNPSGYQTAAQVTASLGAYLPLVGGTLTGNLTLNPSAAAYGVMQVNGTGANNGSALILNKPAGTGQNMLYGQVAASTRWIEIFGNGAAESAGNNGSDYALQRYDNTGAYIDQPLTITRATGFVTIQNGVGAQWLTVQSAGANIAALLLCKGAAGSSNVINGYTGGPVAANLRWQMLMGDNVAEGGSNAGSNWQLTAIMDGGGSNLPVMSAARSTQVVTFAKAIVNGSDARLKENIRPIEGALETVKQLNGVSFNRIGEPPELRNIGFIAKEVAPHSPESVQASASMTVGDALGRSGTESREGDDSPMLALDYGGMVALMAEAVKTLAAKNDEQQAQIDALAAKVEALEAAANG